MRRRLLVEFNIHKGGKVRDKVGNGQIPFGSSWRGSFGIMQIVNGHFSSCF